MPEIPLIHIRKLEETGLVTAVFTTRWGGISTGECAEMNLTFRRNDQPENVIENYRRLCGALGIDPSCLALSHQVHGVTVLEPDETLLGTKTPSEGRDPEGDAWITDRPGIALVRHHADCVPVYLLDPVRHCIGLAHAGWKGTVDSIASVTVEAMQTRFGCDPADMLAVIGPSIGPCCFEITENVIEPLTVNFPGQTFVREENGRHYGDLWACNRYQLERSGIPAERIEVMGVCTACHTETYFSHRREKGHTGTMASLLMLRKS